MCNGIYSAMAMLLPGTLLWLWLYQLLCYGNGISSTSNAWSMALSGNSAVAGAITVY